MPVVLPSSTRTPGQYISNGTVVGFVQTPVDLGDGQGSHRWDEPGSTLIATIDTTNPASDLVYDLAVEGFDGSEWITLVAATGIPAVGTTRDGSPYVPLIRFQSTRVRADQVRAVVSNSRTARFAVRIEVE